MFGGRPRGVKNRRLGQWPRGLLAFAVVAAMVAAIAAPSGELRSAAASGNFSTGDRVFVNTDALNVRSGPSTDDTVLDTISTGTLATVVDGPEAGSGYTWYKLDIEDGTTGWAVSDYLAAASDGGGWASGTRVYVNTDWLNLRSGPSLSNAVVDVLGQDTSGTILDGPVDQDGYTWYKLTADDGGTGWGVAMYLASGDDNGGGDNGGGDNGGGDSGGTAAVVDVPSLNLRDGHGLSYAVITTLAQGTNVTINQGPANEDHYDWYQVTTADGTTGWAVNGFTRTDDAGGGGGFSTNDIVIVADGPLNVRAAAGSDARVIDQLSQGATAAILRGPTVKDGYSWYQVFYGKSSKGWVASEFLQLK